MQSPLRAPQASAFGANASRRRFLGTFAGVFGAWAVHGAAGAGKRVVVWAEGTAPDDKVYPQDVNSAIADGLKSRLPGWTVDLAGLKDAEQGCSEDSLKRCDVLIWWGHKKHDEVTDEHVQRVVRRVREEGMGFIAVHSAHFAKPNRALMGTPCSWKAYETDGCRLRVKVADATHPIAKGIVDFELPQVERYSEPYAVPEPEAVPLSGNYIYPDGKEEPTRVGFCWTRGRGRMFYFSPGHETYRALYREDVRQIFANAVLWAARLV